MKIYSVIIIVFLFALNLMSIGSTDKRIEQIGREIAYGIIEAEFKIPYNEIENKYNKMERNKENIKSLLKQVHTLIDNKISIEKVKEEIEQLGNYINSMPMLKDLFNKILNRPKHMRLNILVAKIKKKYFVKSSSIKEFIAENKMALALEAIKYLNDSSIVEFFQKLESEYTIKLNVLLSELNFLTEFNYDSSSDSDEDLV